MGQTFERVAAAAGAVFVLMAIPAVLLYPNLHPPYEPDRVRVAYVEGAASAALSVGLQLLAVVPFVIFLVALWGRLRASSEGLAMATLVGGIAFIVVLILWQAVLAGVLLQANFVDPEADLRPILSVISSVDQSITLALSVMSGAAGIGILGGHRLPRWLG